MITSLSTPKGEIIIRIATPEDAASLLQLRLEALSTDPEAFAADVEKTAADGVDAWLKLTTENARTQSGAVIIACAGADLIGMSGIDRGHWPKTRHSGTVWGVYVNPDWRGFHIGEAVVNGCVAWAMENGLTMVSLGVNTLNTDAIRCYTRCGFYLIGTRPRAAFYNSIYYDEYLMAKLL